MILLTTRKKVQTTMGYGKVDFKLKFISNDILNISVIAFMNNHKIINKSFQLCFTGKKLEKLILKYDTIGELSTKEVIKYIIKEKMLDNITSLKHFKINFDGCMECIKCKSK
jgi:hypothetical protein